MMHLYVSIFLFVSCLLTGLTTYILGCDTNIDPICIFYNKYAQSPTNILYIYNPCTVCSEVKKICGTLSCSDTCVRTSNNPCYDIKLEFELHNTNCSATYIYQSETKKIIQNSTTYKFYVKKSDNTCYINPSDILAKVGLGLLCSSAFFLCIMGICCWANNNNDSDSNDKQLQSISISQIPNTPQMPNTLQILHTQQISHVPYTPTNTPIHY